MPTGAGTVNPVIRDYWTAFVASLDFVRPHWETYARLYEFWKNKRFDALNATYSRISPAFAYAAVADRLPKIYQNVFSNPDHVSINPRTPEAQLSADSATSWLRHLLRHDIKIESSILPTLTSTLIGGTAYRMPYVTPKRDAASKWTPRIFCRDIEFFHVLPCPGAGGHVNPLDKDQTNAVPWVLWIDWESEDKIKELAANGTYDKDEVAKLLAKPGQQLYLEDSYRDRFATIGNISYGGPSTWRPRTDAIEETKGSHQRRVVHWFGRTFHRIIAEDRFVLYDGPPVFEDGTIPLIKYTISNDLNSRFGISYLGLLEDLLKAKTMNRNFRHDRLLMTMHPPTYMRVDIAEFAKNKGSDLRPKPYDTRFFPQDIQNIQNLIWHDRMPDVPSDAFVEEDRMKAHEQKVGGQSETTTSLGDVVGNKTATGVTSIMGELAARPNMESLCFEQGFRDECQMLLAYGAKFITEPQFVQEPRSEDGFKWKTVTPDQISADLEVETHGTQWMAENQQNFQKLLAFFPYWNNNPAFDPYELNKIAADAVGLGRDRTDKLLVKQEQSPMMEEAAEGEQDPMLGGMASGQDITQSIRSVANRTRPQSASRR